MAASVVGATAEEDEANDDESQASGQPQIPKENCYKVVGTLQDPTQHKPEWVDEVYEVCIELLLQRYLWRQASGLCKGSLIRSVMITSKIFAKITAKIFEELFEGSFN